MNLEQAKNEMYSIERPTIISVGCWIWHKNTMIEKIKKSFKDKELSEPQIKVEWNFSSPLRVKLSVSNNIPATITRKEIELIREKERQNEAT